MSLETLKGKTLPNGQYIEVNNGDNTIKFTIQNGPVKENGVNGCQVDEIIKIAALMVEGLDKQFSCHHNTKAVSYLEDALYALEMRKKDRKKRGVEGQSKA